MTSERAFAEHPLLTAADERRLARLIERGDLQAKDRLVSSNLRLVASGGRRHVGRGPPMEGLLEERGVGPSRGSGKRDWGRGTRLSTRPGPRARRRITPALAK